MEKSESCVTGECMFQAQGIICATAKDKCENGSEEGLKVFAVQSRKEEVTKDKANSWH